MLALTGRPLRRGLRQVVQRDAADRHRGVVTAHPGRDFGRRVAAAVRRANTARNEVVNLAGGYELLELCQRGGRITAVEPADCHHRIASGELVSRCVVRSDGGSNPRIRTRVGLQRGGQGRIGCAATEQPATALAATATEPSGGSGRRCAARRTGRWCEATRRAGRWSSEPTRWLTSRALTTCRATASRTRLAAAESAATETSRAALP